MPKPGWRWQPIYYRCKSNSLINDNTVGCLYKATYFVRFISGLIRQIYWPAFADFREF